MLLGLKNVTNKICRENQNKYFVLTFSENSLVYAIMWKNMTQLDRPQMAIY
jgi:hypothetical protein